MSARLHRPVTPAEYLAAERIATAKHEYWNGAIYAMAGAGRTHNLVTANLIIALGIRLRGRSCSVYPSDMRVKVLATSLYTYPDLAVVCGKALFEDTQGDSLLNPTVLVEVLSPSTEAYDRGVKFAHYRTLPSLCDYLLVTPNEAQIEHYARRPDGNWLLHVHTGLEAVVTLTALACELPLAEVYDKVDWLMGMQAAPSLRLVQEDAVEYGF